MNDAIESQLMRAYELIEAGKLDEARAILNPILASNRNNPDAWWIYAHSVTDPLVAKDALDNVLRLDPEYPGAKELHEQLVQQLGVAPGFSPAPAPPPPPAMIDEPDFGITETATTKAAVEEDEGFNLPRVLLIAAVFVLIAVVALVLANQASQPSTPTAVVNATTASADATEQVVSSVAETAEASTAGDDPVGALTAGLQGFVLRDLEPITVQASDGGQIAFANICGSTNAATLRDTVEALKLALGRVSPSVGSIQTVGIRTFDCATNTQLFQIGVDSQTAAAFASGSLSEREFSDRWVVIQ